MRFMFAAGVAGTLALAGGAFFGGVKYGVQTTRAEQAEQRADASDATLRQVRQLVAGADRIAEAYASRERVIHTQTTTILRETRDAITPETDARYRLPWGFVRMHDAAAGGALLPSAAGEPDGEASTVALSAAADTITLNYGACREDAERLIALQDWARSVTTEGER